MTATGIAMPIDLVLEIILGRFRSYGNLNVRPIAATLGYGIVTDRFFAYNLALPRTGRA